MTLPVFRLDQPVPAARAHPAGKAQDLDGAGCRGPTCPGLWGADVPRVGRSLASPFERPDLPIVQSAPLRNRSRCLRGWSCHDASNDAAGATIDRWSASSSPRRGDIAKLVKVGRRARADTAVLPEGGGGEARCHRSGESAPRVVGRLDDFLGRRFQDREGIDTASSPGRPTWPRSPDPHRSLGATRGRCRGRRPARRGCGTDAPNRHNGGPFAPARNTPNSAAGQLSISQTGVFSGLLPLFCRGGWRLQRRTKAIA